VHKKNEVSVDSLTSIDEHLDELSELLIEVVDQGASVGFLPPLNRHEAQSYWKRVVNSETVLFVARIKDQIVGTVQLQLASKQNGLHRAEIAKLMTHPNFRRLGIAQSLMRSAEERAIGEGRTLLVLDTRDGDPSNQLYLSLGYQYAGQIPNYALSTNGKYHSTNFYYKNL